MEWVEVQGKTVDLAVDVAMAELGAASRDEIQVEVIQEPKAGFLGMGGQEAIVKVTKAPKKRRRRNRGRGGKAKGEGNATAEASTSGRSGKPSSGSNGGKGSKNQKSRNGGRSRSSESRGNARQEAPVSTKDTSSRDGDDRPDPAPISEQAEVAREFLAGLLDAFGLEGEVTTRIDDDVLYLDVSGEQTEALVGQRGSVMQSVLELTRTVVQRKTYGAPRMRIDIAGYGERRREALRIYAGKLAAQVIEDQSEIMLEPMNAADRKVLHDAAAEIDGVRSFSEGEEPRRAVVLAYDGE